MHRRSSRTCRWRGSNRFQLTTESKSALGSLRAFHFLVRENNATSRSALAEPFVVSTILDATRLATLVAGLSTYTLDRYKRAHWGKSFPRWHISARKAA